MYNFSSDVNFRCEKLFCKEGANTDSVCVILFTQSVIELVILSVQINLSFV